MYKAACRRPVLIVEDDVNTSSLVSIYLEREGFDTLPAYDGRQALDLARRHNPQFAILDLMLPDVDGWQVCRELRQSTDIPILMLTARGEAHERVLGLTLGADDYVAKPFSPAELVARVKAILRRGAPQRASRPELLSYGRLVLDREKRRVTVDGEMVALTRSEYTLLEALMAAPGRIFLREELLDHLYPTGEGVIDRVVDVHVGKLRQKIEEDPTRPQCILTARGMGYHFADLDGDLRAR